MGSTGLVESRRQRRGNVARHGNAGVLDDGVHEGWFERVHPTCAVTLSAVVDALERGVEPPVTLDDGIRAQAVAEAASRALRSRREEVVTYP